MRTTCLLLSSTVVVADLTTEFSAFKVKFGKTYASAAEEAQRLEVFAANFVRVEKINAEAGVGATNGVTKFSDLTEEEFKATYLRRAGLEAHSEFPMWDGECTACKRFPEHKALMAAPPTDFDWETKGAVTKVKDQGQCGSCWTFGTTGDVEGTWFLANNTLTSLSEQELVSCDTATNEGCNGGLQEDAFVYVEKHGLTTEASYPYTSGGGKDGRCESAKIVAPLTKISSWVQVSKTAAGEAGMKDALSKSGPITIGINAGHLQTYRSGIMDPAICRSSASALDHAVLVVGYGTENGQDYWKIKNSWAADWGEKGYFRIVGGKNKCGIASDAVHSVV
jgi:C1A family cysteine protease